MDDATDTTTTTELPQDVEQLFEQADVMAVLQAHRRALDAHRKEMLLLWVSVCLVAGLLTYQFAREVLADAGLPD